MFSKDIYKKQNGFLFIVLSWAMFFYLLIIVFLLIFSKDPITYPSFLENYEDFLSILIGCLFMICFVGFPFSLSLYKGMKNLYVNSKLNINENKIYYIQQTEALWTIFGRSTEYKIYNVLNIKKYKISKRWIKIYGKIEEEVVYNKSKSNRKNVEYVKIARAFDTDKQVIEFLKNI